jgi:hypothetical protein
MKYLLTPVAILLFIAVLFPACDDGNPDLPNYIIIHNFPEQIYPVNTVTITGENFGTDKSIYTVDIDGSLPCEIISISDSELRFAVPDIPFAAFEKERQATVYISVDANYGLFHLGGGSGTSRYTRDVVLKAKEPTSQGWHYMSRVESVYPLNIAWYAFDVTPDGTVWIFNPTGLYKSLDGGFTWLHTSMPGVGNAAFLDRNTVWIYMGNREMRYTVDGQNYTVKEDLSFIKESSWGMWMETPETGFIMTNEKLWMLIENMEEMVVYENGTYCRNLSVIHRSNYAFSDRKNLIYGTPGDFGPTKYDLSADIRDGEWISGLQLLEEQTVYLTCGNVLYRVSWPLRVSAIPQMEKVQAFRFVTPQQGYAINDGVIYKTVDGAKTWQQEFVLEEGMEPTAIREHKGCVYVFLHHQDTDCILKYIP